MMIRTRPRSARQGTVTVVVAVSMIAILGFVALSLDGGMMLDKRRQTQVAADAAALAACDDLYSRWYTNSTSGLDNSISVTIGGINPTSVTGTAKAAAKAAAAANGFADGVGGCVVTVNIPPLSGDHVGQAGHVEVYISISQARGFSKVFGTTAAVPIGSRAVARGKRTSIKQAILVLDPLGSSAFNAGGNGAVSVTGSPIQVNSTSASGMIDNGGGSSGSISDTAGFSLGGIPGWTTTGGATITGPITSNAPPIPDPLAKLPAPDTSTMTVQSTKKINFSSANPLTLNPGIYQGGITVSGKGDLFLNPGIYVMQGGGFSVTGQGNITGAGVMIYNDPQSSSDKISFAGSGILTLSPPTSGTYQGITLFQNRTSTAEMDVSGGSGSVMSGLFYTAAATLKVTGGGGASIGSQYISYDLTLQGNGNFSVDWNPNTTPGQRQLYLVE
jgi:hypothetical protein